MTDEAVLNAPWQVWQLADDPEVYGEDAAGFIVTTHDGEHEITGIVEEDIAERIVEDHNARLEAR